MICRYCDASNLDSSLRCDQCGALLATEKPSSAVRSAKGGKSSGGKLSTGKSISSPYPRVVAHVAKKKRKKKVLGIQIKTDFDPRLGGRKSIKKKLGSTKRVARKLI